MAWHWLDHMQTICTLLRTDNHTNTPSLNVYRPDVLPDAQPTVSKHCRHLLHEYCLWLAEFGLHICFICGSVLLRLVRWTCDWLVAGLSLAILLSGNNLGQVVHIHMTLVTKQYSSVPVKGRWCPADGKVTVGLASHWPCITGFSGLSTYGLTA